jgi:hypothetical protein
MCTERPQTPDCVLLFLSYDQDCVLLCLSFDQPPCPFLSCLLPRPACICTDKDCGGPVCPACDLGNACKRDSDCGSSFCSTANKTCLCPPGTARSPGGLCRPLSRGSAATGSSSNSSSIGTCANGRRDGNETGVFFLRVHACMPACMHPCVYACQQADTRTCMTHARAHTGTQAHMHTRARLHTGTAALPTPSSLLLPSLDLIPSSLPL